jgi:hypothetical protein
MALVHKYVMSDRQDLFTLASNNRGVRTMRAAQVKNVSSSNLPGPILGRNSLRSEQWTTGTSYQRV